MFRTDWLFPCRFCGVLFELVLELRTLLFPAFSVCDIHRFLSAQLFSIGLAVGPHLA